MTPSLGAMDLGDDLSAAAGDRRSRARCSASDHRAPVRLRPPGQVHEAARPPHRLLVGDAAGRLPIDTVSDHYPYLAAGAFVVMVDQVGLVDEGGRECCGSAAGERREIGDFDPAYQVGGSRAGGPRRSPAVNDHGSLSTDVAIGS